MNKCRLSRDCYVWLVVLIGLGTQCFVARAKEVSHYGEQRGRCLSFYNATQRPITLILDVYENAALNRVSSWFSRKFKGKEQTVQQRVLHMKPFEIASIKQMPRAALRERLGGKAQYVKNVALDPLSTENAGHEFEEGYVAPERLIELTKIQVGYLNDFFNTLSDTSACVESKDGVEVLPSQLVHIIDRATRDKLQEDERQATSPLGSFADTDLYLYYHPSDYTPEGVPKQNEEPLRSGEEAFYLDFEN